MHIKNEAKYVQEIQHIQKRFDRKAHIAYQTRDVVSYLKALRLFDNSLTEITNRHNNLSVKNSIDWKEFV